MQRVSCAALVAALLSTGCGEVRVGGGTAPPGGRSWSAPVTLTSLATPAAHLRLAGTPGGDAFAAWEQVDTSLVPSRTQVFARRFVKGSGWEGAEAVSPTSGDARKPEVAVNDDGHAIVVWEQEVGLTTEVHAARYVAGAGWQDPEDVDGKASADDQTAPAVGLDAARNAVVVWLQLAGGAVSVWANSFVEEGADPGWQRAGVIETRALVTSEPRIAVSPLGRAVAVWRFGPTDVGAAEYVPGSDLPWRLARVIDDLDGDVSAPQVGIDAAGRAVAVWAQFDSRVGLTTIRANRLASSLWDDPTRIDGTNVGSAGAPALAVDATGAGLAVWPQRAGTLLDIRAARFTPVAGWSSARTIETDNAGSASAPSVAANDGGAGLAVWQQADGSGRSRIWSNAFDPARGWDEARRVDEDNTRTGTAPRVALDATGDGVAVWLDGSQLVQAATYE